MRCVHAIMSLEGDDEVHGDGCFDGEFADARGLIGSLAECGGEARYGPHRRMGWDANGVGNSMPIRAEVGRKAASGRWKPEMPSAERECLTPLEGGVYT